MAPTPTPTSRAANLVRVSREVVRDVFDGRFERVVARFSDTMTASLSAKNLGKATSQYEDLFGKFRAQGRSRVYDRAPITVVTIALRMANRPGEARVSYDTSDKIAGFFLLPAGQPVPTAPA